MRKIRDFIQTWVLFLGYVFIGLGAISIPVINFVLQIIEKGFVVEFIFIWHWSMLIGIGAIVLGFILCMISIFSNNGGDKYESI